MTNENPSRNATLADVLTYVSNADLSEKKRGELCSAIRTVGRALNRPLDQVPADSKSLRRRLNDISPIAAGVSPGRWANIRSHLRTALRIAKLTALAKTPQSMSPEWSSFFERLPSRSARMRLSRMFRHLSGAGIGPTTVTSEDLKRFRDALLDDPLIKNPGSTWRETAWTWNTARSNLAGWPDIQISLPSRRVIYTLPANAFPESFRRDVNGYLDRIRGADLTEELPFRPVRESTRRTRERQLYLAASALVHRGREPSSITSLADLVSIESFKEILRFLIDRRGDTSSSAIEQLAGFLKSVAKHWVRVDASVLEQMSIVVKRVSVPQRGMTAKNRERLRVFDDEHNVLALVQLPQQLMKEAVSGGLSPMRAALVAQSAVAIELLLMRPLRIANLARLELDQHLIRPPRKSTLWRVSIVEEEVKNDVNLEYELPSESGTLLEVYLRDFRPLLAKPGNAVLFPGRNGVGTKAKHTLAGQIVKVVQRFTGLKVNSHLFRHFAGLVHLNAHPGEYSVVAHVLGHKSIDTTRKSYTGMEGPAAVRHFDKTITEYRERRQLKQTDLRRARRSHPWHKSDGSR